MDQAPAIAQEIVAREIAQCWFVIALSSIVFVACAILLRFASRGFDNAKGNEEKELCGGICVGAIAAGIISLAPLLFHVYGLISVWVAPKMFVLEHIAKLVK